MRALVETAILAALFLAGAVLERTRGGVELVYLCLPLVLLGPAVRRVAAWRGRCEPAPRVTFALEVASFAGLATSPFSPLGLGLAGVAALLASGAGDGGARASRGETALGAVLGAAAVLLAGARLSSSDLAPLLTLGLGAFLVVESCAPSRSPGSAAAARRASAFAVLLAAALVHRFDAHLARPHARDVLLSIAVFQAALTLAALAGHDTRLPRPRGALAALLVLAAGLELGARLVEPRLAPAGPLYRPHPYTCFAPDPTSPVHTKDGLRPPAVTRAKSPGTYRIALVGGTPGHEGDRPFDETWAAYLEEVLARRFEGRRVEVLNAAVGSYNSSDTFARFHGKVLDYEPDLVLDCDGLDDLWPMLCSGPFENDLRHARRVPVSRPAGPIRTILSLSAFGRVLGSVVSRGEPSVDEIAYVPFEASEERYRPSTSALVRNLEDMAFICRGRRIRLALTTEPLDAPASGEDAHTRVLRRAAGDLNGALRDVAARLGLALVDLDRLMPRDAPGVRPAERAFADARRATVRGDRLKANLTADVLAPLLEQDLGAKATPFVLDTAPAESYPKARLVR